VVLTAAALGVLTAADPAPSRLVEVSVLAGAGALGGLVRFGVLYRLRPSRPARAAQV
jgi:hypothetical protein